MPVRKPAAEWLTPQELADELKVPLDTVYAWRTKNTGPLGVRFGRHVRYTRSDVDAWIREKYSAASPA